MELFNSKDFAQHISNLIEEWHSPGLAIALVQNQKIVSRGYGNASLNPGKPTTADTLFDIASSSKSLTAASVALLVNDDDRFPQVEWESKMSDLLPDDFVMSKSSYTDDITVEDVLSHRTGLPSHDSSYLGIKAKHPDSPKSVTQNLRNLEISAPIRTKYQYCNLMFTVATHLVEQLTGQTFADFLKQHFFVPLGMDSTHLQPSATKAAGLEDRMATQYCWRDKNQTYAPVEMQECPEAQGAGSIFTSVNDYIRWVKALMNQEDPITRAVYKGLVKPRICENPNDVGDDLDPYTSPTFYGAGLEMFYYRGHHVVKHDGLIDGSGSCHFFLPEIKFGGVILANSDAASDLGTIISRELIDEVLKVPKDERPDWNARQHKLDEKSEKDEESKGEEDLIGSTHEQRLDLSVYTGQYLNAGYHDLKVEIKDYALFIDATDRSMGFTLTFKNRRSRDKFTATLSSYFEPGINDEKLEAGFRFEDNKVVQMGIKFEEALDGLIWFDKIYP